jgi:hypothetical protein
MQTTFTNESFQVKWGIESLTNKCRHETFTFKSNGESNHLQMNHFESIANESIANESIANDSIANAIANDSIRIKW